MTKGSLAALAFSAAVLTASQASATIMVSAGPTAPFATSAVENFSTQPGGTPVNDSIFNFSGTGTITTGTNPNINVQPGGTTGNYLAVMGGNTETLNLVGSPVTTIGLQWGSIDTYNSLEVLGLGGVVLHTYSGSDVAAGALTAGLPTVAFGQTSDFVTISGLGNIYGLELLSPNPTYPGSGNSFEVDNISLAAAVPETSTWAMMVLGFFGVGFLSYRTRNRRPALRLV